MLDDANIAKANKLYKLKKIATKALIIAGLTLTGIVIGYGIASSKSNEPAATDDTATDNS